MIFPKILLKSWLAGLISFFIAYWVLLGYSVLIDGEIFDFANIIERYLDYEELLGYGAFALFVTTIYAAPVYALLQFKGVAYLLTVILAGAAPGLLMMFFIGHIIAGIMSFCGILMACLTHFIYSIIYSKEAKP